VRRSLGGTFLLAAGVLFALALSTLWLQRVAFSPSADTGSAQAILDDETIRGELATLIASADAPVLGMSSTQLKEFIEQIAVLDAGAAVMADIVRDAHSLVIGQRDDPVRVSAEEQVAIVRNELVALEPPITLPVQEVTAMSFIRTLTGWTWIAAGGLGVLAILAGLVIRPEQGEPTLALGVGFGALALMFPFFGFLVPFVLLPALSDDTWMGIFPRLAQESRTITFVVSIVSLVLAVLIRLRTTGGRQRRQGSTPLSVGRYRDQRWSR
jgi:hypothetical protein